MLGVGEIVFFREEHTNWSSNQRVNPANIHMSNSIQAELVIFRNMYKYLVTIYEKKRGQEFEESREDIEELLEKGKGRD